MKSLFAAAALLFAVAGFTATGQAQVLSLEGVQLSPLPKTVGTKFNFGILFRADFRNAALGPATQNDKGKKIMTLFEGAHLQGSNFDGANVSGAIFRDALLNGASLQGTNFTGANLTAANFEGADLRGANFTGARLENARFGGANVDGAVFNGANIDGAKFTGSSGPNLVNTSGKWNRNP
jgi:uncharacterized protein YjbI with pentapeptide repeats